MPVAPAHDHLRSPLPRVFTRAVLGLLALVLCAPIAQAITPFVIETADDQGTLAVGQYPSIDVDRNGDLHVSYYAPSMPGLKYAVRRNGVWRSETVDDLGTVGWDTSIRVAHDGTVHISYYSFTNDQLKYARGTFGNWSIEIVDDPGNVGEFTSIALDTDGVPHISYFDRTNGNLKYAHRTGGVWTTETADASVNDVGDHTSLELTTAGDPVISYHDITNGDLRLARKEGLVWTTELVDGAATNTGTYTSLELDSQGNPHIAYNDLSGTGVKYAFLTTSGWVTESADPDASAGLYSALALAADGTAMVSYRGSSTDLRFARRTNGVWERQVVDASGNVGVGTSIHLDAEGTPFIAYYYQTGPDLRVADASLRPIEPAPGALWAAGSQQVVRWKGGGAVDLQLSADGGTSFTTVASVLGGNEGPIRVPDWSTEEALLRIVRTDPPATGLSGRFSIGRGAVPPWWREEIIAGSPVRSSIALDAENRPRVSHNRFNRLYYSERIGDTWIHEEVDATFTSGNHNSLALDELGNPHVAYEEGANDDLKYATRVGGVWMLETVDAGGDVGRTPSLALDAGGDPHISYRDFDNARLKYATKSGGVWTIEIVDASADVGDRSSIAIDSEGNPHVVYHDATNQDLKYARRGLGGWTIEIVDAGIVFSGASLALDGAGVPHVAYRLEKDLVSFVGFAERRDGVWKREIATERLTGQGIEMALTPAGEPRIVLHEPIDGDLYEVSRFAGRWVERLLASDDDVGEEPSIAIDDDGRRHLSFRDQTNSRILYATEALQIDDPTPGAIWPVGAKRTITWDGNGLADVFLSLDAGESWELLAARAAGGEHRLTVPHAPTRFAKMKVVRAVPFSESVTESLFTIETDIVLLGLKAIPLETGGARVTWSTDPGPADLAGYRLERGHAGGWQDVVGLTRETSVVDPAGGLGSRYRLFGVNGLGDELLLGTVALAPAEPLAAWPLPYRGGTLSVSFAVFGRLGEAAGEAEVALYDLAGRKRATLARGRFEGAQQQVTWDGTDDAGRRLTAGVYFLSARSGGFTHRLKIVVLP